MARELEEEEYSLANGPIPQNDGGELIKDFYESREAALQGFREITETAMDDGDTLTIHIF